MENLEHLTKPVNEERNRPHYSAKRLAVLKQEREAHKDSIRTCMECGESGSWPEFKTMFIKHKKYLFFGPVIEGYICIHCDFKNG